MSAWNLGAGLDGRGALVSGATGAIGSEVAAALAAAGARVAATDLDGAALDALVAALPGGAERHLALPADLRDPAACEPLVAQAVARLGRLDVLVHVAGLLRRVADLDEVTVEQWDLQEQVNLRASFFLNRAAAAAMRAGGAGGRIVNFASQGWWTGGYGGSVVYNAMKGGIVTMSRGLAREYASDGILVNCVAPGAVDTPMLREGMTEEQLEAFRAQIPLGRFAQPQEIVGAVVFLASDHARYVTGATLNVSGGQLMY